MWEFTPTHGTIKTKIFGDDLTKYKTCALKIPKY